MFIPLSACAICPSKQQIASHGLFDLIIEAKGDHWIDDHHTNEDIGLAFGTALAQVGRPSTPYLIPYPSALLPSPPHILSLTSLSPDCLG